MSTVSPFCMKCFERVTNSGKSNNRRITWFIELEVFFRQSPNSTRKVNYEQPFCRTFSPAAFDDYRYSYTSSYDVFPNYLSLKKIIELAKMAMSESWLGESLERKYLITTTFNGTHPLVAN